MSSKFSVYCKNTKPHTDDRLAVLLGEMNHCQWDVVLFSETRRNSGHCKITGGHKLYSSSQQTVAAAVAIVVIYVVYTCFKTQRAKHFTLIFTYLSCKDVISYIMKVHGVRVFSTPPLKTA